MSRRGATHADESGPSHRRRRDEAEDLEDEEDEREEEEGNENVDPEDRPPTNTPEEYEEAANNALADPVCSDHSSEEVQKCVTAVVRRMLFKGHSQPGVPVKREELTEMVGKMLKGRRGLPSIILTIAQHQILDVFGLEMREMQKKRVQKRCRGLSQAVEEASVAKTYALHTILPPSTYAKHVEQPKTTALKGIIATVVCIIQGGGGRIDEELFWSHLASVGVKKDCTDHPQFGNVDDTLNLLTKQRYVVRERKTEQEGDGFVYTIGESAVSDFGVKNIKKVFAKVAARE